MFLQGIKNGTFPLLQCPPVYPFLFPTPFPSPPLSTLPSLPFPLSPARMWQTNLSMHGPFLPCLILLAATPVNVRYYYLLCSIMRIQYIVISQPAFTRPRLANLNFTPFSHSKKKLVLELLQNNYTTLQANVSEPC